MSSLRHVALAVLLLLALRTSSTSAQDSIGVDIAFPSVGDFSLPVDLAADGNGYLYVVEQGGKIFVFENDEAVSERSVFLDLSDRVYADGEAGLLSLAFHPDYEVNGYAYVYYILEAKAGEPTDWTAVLSRFTRSESDPLAVDPDSELILLEIPQPTDRHNGGETAFGPDGYLYLSLGDGSAGDDAFGNGQNLTTLLGSILRIDVDNPSDERAYGIPPDNPFAGNDQGYREEIFAYGFRNPWRFSIDHETGHVWAGDVGEQSWEEVDFVVKGRNYGWPVMEGGECYDPPTNCTQDPLVPPVWYYSHDDNRVSVIGGYVYRGRRVPELVGHYIFADWGGRMLYGLEYDGNPNASTSEPVVTELVNTGYFISGFGVDEHDELYMVSTFHGGPILRFVETTDPDLDPEPEPPETPIADFSFEHRGASPTQGTTSFVLGVPERNHVRVTLFDAIGRELKILVDAQLEANTKRVIELDTSVLPSGVYFVRAAAATGTVTEQIVVAH
ncbi:MAG: PQQ-dependent sugar dehydrogenase [Rhodothermales bacterium]